MTYDTKKHKRGVKQMENTEKVGKANSAALTNVKWMTIGAMSIALTYIATGFINIRLPIQANGGLIHLGNTVLFIAAVLFGKKIGAIAGGVGMALFDLTSGWATWAPFTFIIVGLMGFVVGLVTEKSKKAGWIILGMTLALIIKVAGYYIAEVILYGNWLAPVTSIPGNIIQVVVGGIIAFPLIEALRKIIKN